MAEPSAASSSHPRLVRPCRPSQQRWAGRLAARACLIAAAGAALWTFASAANSNVDTAFAWPSRPVKTKRGPSPRSKQNLIRLLKDHSAHPSKTLWAIRYMNKMKFFKSNWEYTLAMKKLSQVGLQENALELWKEMCTKNLEQSPASYTAAIVALNTKGSWREALKVVDDMALQNMLPLKIGCEHALMACERGHLWEKAIFLLDKMYEYGDDPDETTSMPAIRACENAGQFEAGTKLFWEMRDRTKLMKAEQEIGYASPYKKPPRAAEATWRVPGAIAPDAYDPPKLLKMPGEEAVSAHPNLGRPAGADDYSKTLAAQAENAKKKIRKGDLEAITRDAEKIGMRASDARRLRMRKSLAKMDPSDFKARAQAEAFEIARSDLGREGAKGRLFRQTPRGGERRAKGY